MLKELIRQAQKELARIDAQIAKLGEERNAIAGIAGISGGNGTASPKRGKTGSKVNIPKTCVFPGCRNPANGPRYSFACRKHGKQEAARKKYYQAWRERNG